MSPELKKRLAATGLVSVVALVASAEGLRQKVYVDPVGIPTVCFGHTGADVQLGQARTLEQCEDLLAVDLLAAQDAVRSCVAVPLSAGERGAYASFTYNVGRRAFCSSTIVRKLNAGDHASACAQLSRWVYATKAGVAIELPGLVKRRAAERAMCEGKPS